MAEIQGGKSILLKNKREYGINILVFLAMLPFLFAGCNGWLNCSFTDLYNQRIENYKAQLTDEERDAFAASLENIQKIDDTILREIVQHKDIELLDGSDEYEDLVKNGLIDVINVLKQKFLFFFESVYFKSLRKFNLKDFGLIDLQIELPKKIPLYEDLLMKNKKDGNFEEYKIKMEKCIKWHFLGGLEADEKLKEI